MFIPQARNTNNWWIYSRPKISVFLLYSRDMFSEVVENDNLKFTCGSVFVFEVSAWKVCLCVRVVVC